VFIDIENCGGEMENVLIKDKMYSGTYVAILDMLNPKVISNGKTPIDAINSAKQKGVENPMIVFVPLENMVQIY